MHYAPERPVNNGSIIDRKLTDDALPLLNKLIDKINNEIKPDVVFCLGDLVEDFNDKAQDIDNLKFIWQKLKEINTPFYSLAGNHDLRSMDKREEVEEIMEYKHSTFSVDACGCHFVLLGLDVRPDFGRDFGGIFKTQFLSEEDLKWLKDDLSKNSLPVVIFSHFGIAEDDMKGNWWFEKNPDHALLGNRKELKEILQQDKNLLAVISGHQHWTKFHIEDGISYYVIGSMTENINDDGVPDGVYFEIEIKNKNISILEKHIKIEVENEINKEFENKWITSFVKDNYSAKYKDGVNDLNFRNYLKALTIGGRYEDCFYGETYGFLWNAMAFNFIEYLKDEAADLTFDKIDKKGAMEILYDPEAKIGMFNMPNSLKENHNTSKQIMDEDLSEFYVVGKDYSWCYVRTHEEERYFVFNKNFESKVCKK